MRTIVSQVCVHCFDVYVLHHKLFPLSLCCFSYTATVFNVTEHPFAIENSFGLKFQALPFNSGTKGAYIYSIQAFLKVGANDTDRKKRQSDDEKAFCGIVFAGEPSEVILVSNGVRSVVATLA